MGRYVFAGLLTLVVFVGGLVVWSVTATLSSAVAVQGVLAPGELRHVVQHPQGGQVTAVLVREGERVAAGAVLLRLEMAEQGEQKAALEHLLFDLAAQSESLRVLLGGEGPQNYDAMSPATPEQADVLARERAIFEATRAEEAAVARRYEARAAQAENAITGSDAQIAALFEERALLQAGVADQRALLQRGLTPLQQVRALERELAALSGRLGRVLAERAGAAQMLAELAEERATQAAARRAERLVQHRDAAYRMAEARAKLRLIEAELDQAEIRAPVGGFVFGLTAQTAAAVVGPAERIMWLIPTEAAQQASLRVAPVDIDELRLGQPVTLQLSSLDHRMVPEVKGEVTTISADAHQDDRTGQRYFEVGVRVLPGQVADLPPGVTLKVGMPVEAYIKTGDHTPLTYLSRPFAAYFTRAFREG